MQAVRRATDGGGSSWLAAVVVVVVVWAIASLMLLGCGRSSTPTGASKRAAAPSATQPRADGTSTPAGGDVETTAATANLGKQLYARHCAACHGEQGDGIGVATAFLFPKPRDFRAGRFRLVSTSNNVPSRDDLQAVLLRGMPGSAMPPWKHLDQAQRDALVDEVMRLRREGVRQQAADSFRAEGLSDEEIASDDVQQDIDGLIDRLTTPGESSKVPDIPPVSEAAVARGAEIYVKQACNKCHGDKGLGDGQEKMTDAEGLPTSPRDFTRGIFKGGHDVASIFRRTAYGMPGTPMPSSANLTPDQVIDLCFFVRSLSDEAVRQSAILSREKIVAQAVDAIPEAPGGDAWRTVEPVGLRMTPLWWRNDADRDLQVQAVHDGQVLAVRVSWRDETQDGHAAMSQSFEDAVAMELYRGDAEPFLGMGDTTSPVDVWFWDADRQGIPTAVEDLYPRTVVDVFPFSETVVATAELDRAGARTADQPEISLPVVASGNLITPTDATSGGSSLTVGGPGSVTFRIPQSQLVDARGWWADGRWTVVMTRSLYVASESDGISLEPGGRASVAFAVWDGSHQDRDGKKLITIWQDLELEP